MSLSATNYPTGDRPPIFITHDPRTQTQLDLLDRYIRGNVPILITGESGSGKDLIARILHHKFERFHKNAQPFVTVNCAQLRGELLEATLFGHIRGAFTGAREDRKGLIAEANEGTLFLDEIGELPLLTQAKLLRLLDSGEYRSVGCNKLRRSRFRLICATHRHLSTMVTKGTFRKDLHYRIECLPLAIPPLKSRSADIVPLVRHYLAQLGPNYGHTDPQLPREEIKSLENYAFPGNVRELIAIVHRALVRADPGEAIRFGAVLAEIEVPRLEKLSSFVNLGMTYEEYNIAFIRQTIAACDGQIAGATGAAARLGLAPGTLRGKMKKLNIL